MIRAANSHRQIAIGHQSHGVVFRPEVRSGGCRLEAPPQSSVEQLFGTRMREGIERRHSMAPVSRRHRRRVIRCDGCRGVWHHSGHGQGRVRRWRWGQAAQSGAQSAAKTAARWHRVTLQRSVVRLSNEVRTFVS